MRSKILERVTNESFVVDHVTFFNEVTFVTRAHASRLCFYGLETGKYANHHENLTGIHICNKNIDINTQPVFYLCDLFIKNFIEEEKILQKGYNNEEELKLYIELYP